MSSTLILGLHLATAHFGAPAGAELTGANPGIYLRTGAGLTAGHYRNSHGRPSTYAGWTWATADGRWSLTAGAVTGYPRARVSPLLAPSLRLPLPGDSGLAARITYLPKPHSHGAHGLHLSMEQAW